jgi:hypothetical protein
LAGQPQDPWQSYSPPSADNNDTYAYPGGQGFGQAQANARPAQGYPSAYTVQDQPFTGQATGDQGYPGAHGQEGPPWDAATDTPATAVSRTTSDAKGFFGALFDFGFNSFVTPKIIKVLYVLYTIWMVVWALIFLRLGFKYGGAAGGIFTLIVVDPIFLLLTLGAYRVILELFMVIHRIHDELRAIREQTDQRG